WVPLAEILAGGRLETGAGSGPGKPTWAPGPEGRGASPFRDGPPFCREGSGRRPGVAASGGSLGPPLQGVSSFLPSTSTVFAEIFPEPKWTPSRLIVGWEPPLSPRGSNRMTPTCSSSA